MSLSDSARDQFVRMRREEILAASKDGMVKRQESWTLEYLDRQYMRELDSGELEERFEDVFVNLNSLNAKGQISSGDWKGPQSFGRLFADILTEKQLRGDGLRGGEQFERYGALSRRYLGKECAVPQSLWDQSYLFKVGRIEFLEDALRRGRLRVSPNAFYQDSSLNAGMHDTEGVIEIVVTPSDQAWHLRSEGRSVPAGLKTFRGRQRAKYPYYMWCCSEVFRPEIAANFEGDACLVIKDRKRFASRFAEEMHKLLGRETRAGKVFYVDPLNAKLGRYDVPFAKHFRFAYQREYRLVTTMTDAHRRDPVFIEIGSMQEYAELHPVHVSEAEKLVAGQS